MFGKFLGILTGYDSERKKGKTKVIDKNSYLIELEKFENNYLSILKRCDPFNKWELTSKFYFTFGTVFYSNDFTKIHSALINHIKKNHYDFSYNYSEKFGKIIETGCKFDSDNEGIIAFGNFISGIHRLFSFYDGYLELKNGTLSNEVLDSIKSIKEEYQKISDDENNLRFDFLFVSEFVDFTTQLVDGIKRLAWFYEDKLKIVLQKEMLYESKRPYLDRYNQHDLSEFSIVDKNLFEKITREVSSSYLRNGLFTKKSLSYSTSESFGMRSPNEILKKLVADLIVILDLLIDISLEEDQNITEIFENTYRKALKIKGYYKKSERILPILLFYYYLKLQMPLPKVFSSLKKDSLKVKNYQLLDTQEIVYWFISQNTYFITGKKLDENSLKKHILSSDSFSNRNYF